MVRIFEPNDFVEDAAGVADVVLVAVFTGGAPEMSASALDECFASRS